jgi:hypothetical protein
LLLSALFVSNAKHRRSFWFLSPLFIIWSAIGRNIKGNRSAHSFLFYSLKEKESSTVGSGQKTPKGRQPTASLAVRRFCKSGARFAGLLAADKKAVKKRVKKKRPDSFYNGGGVRFPFRGGLCRVKDKLHTLFFSAPDGPPPGVAPFSFFSNLAPD